MHGPSVTRIAEVLPGRWNIRASNLVHWLSGERLSPVLSYEINAEEPLTLVDNVSYSTADGKHHVIRGQARWTRDGFTRRGSGMKRFSFNRWTVGGLSEDGNVVVIRHGKAQSASDGIEVIVRESVGNAEIRAAIAHEPEVFRLGLEDFACLTWFPAPRG